jgi:hypothetical protein
MLGGDSIQSIPAPIANLAYIEELASQTNDVTALAEAFTSPGLPGASADHRLVTILNATEALPYQHFEGDFGAEYGFANEFADGTGQMGHFLTAVSLGYFSYGDPFLETNAMSLIVGHEMVADAGGRSGLIRTYTHAQQYRAAANTPGAVSLFGAAVNADIWGNNSLRDKYLSSILSMGDEPMPRYGNSIQDLRLSIRGWRFGRLIASGIIQDKEEARDWILGNIAQ